MSGRGEEKTRASEDLFRDLFDNTRDCIAVLRASAEGEDFVFVDFNKAAERADSIRRDEVVGKSVQALFPGIETFGLLDVFRRVWMTGVPEHHPVSEYRDQRLHGWRENYVYRLRSGEIVAIYEDVTAQKQMEARLRESESKYRSLVSNIPGVVFAIDLEGNLTFVSHQAQEMLGYGSWEALGMSVLAFIPEEDRQRVTEAIQQGMAGTKIRTLQVPVLTKSGERLLFECSFARLRQAGRVIGAQGVAVDITERSRSHEQLRTSEAQLSNALRMARAGHWEYDVPNDTFTFNDNFYRIFRTTKEEVGGYTMSSAEYARRFCHPDDMHMVGEETRAAINTDDPYYGRDLEHRILYPDGTVGHIAVRFFVVKDAAGRTVRTYGVNQDITQRLEAEQRIKSALENAIRAIAETIEIRDPYTAGHQKRVTSLAVAIAEKMGLPDEQIQGIRVAATLHDIGKISTPAEILSKPGRLSEQEFALIQEHPKVAYAILKGIDFPWPVADIVLQHHERLDGSGYPRGIGAKDAILLESQVLAVADVVEAMAAHRPYRPALGIGAALEEIRSKQGIAFSSDVVDACVELLENREFTFDE
jgi:PAS domain S-box-containing protein/putative nucleotidyltransferase with HDIG domain